MHEMMFGFGYNHFSVESKNLILNIFENFQSTPMYSAYDIESFTNPNGVISLLVSKSGDMVNRFDFYSDGQDGKIGSIAIYGSSLKGHADAISSSMKIFGLPVSDVSRDYDFVDVTLDDYDVPTLKESSIVDSLLSGNNNPDVGELKFDSTDHIRYQNGIDVSGHNYGCHRQVIIQNNINDMEGYSVSILNLDGNHPLWGNNVQMAPKQMRITHVHNNTVSLIGYGVDIMGNSFSDYAVDIFFLGREVYKIVLKMLDRNVELEYLK